MSRGIFSMRILFVVIFVCASMPVSAQNVCTGLLSYTGRDFNTSARENSVAASVYSEHCQGNSARKDASTSVGIDAIVKAIPVKFRYGGSSSEEKLNNFCKIYDQRRAEFSSERIDSSTVVTGALTAFNDCVGLAARDIYFSPSIGKTLIVVDIKRGGEPASITGIQYDSNLLSCRLPAEESKGPSIVADKDTNRVLNTAYLSLVCERLGQSSKDDVKLYPAVELTITTSRGGLLLPIAADAEMPLKYASELAEQTKTLEKQLEEQIGALRDSQKVMIDATKGAALFGGSFSVQDGVCPIKDSRANVVTGSYSCPASFSVSEIGRFRGSESNCGVTQYICFK